MKYGIQQEYTSVNNTCEKEPWRSSQLECAVGCMKVRCAGMTVSPVEEGGQSNCVLVSTTDDLPSGMWITYLKDGLIFNIFVHKFQ